MPKGTRVSRCVEKVKKSGRGVNPYAVCQASTKQSYATGKKLRSKKMNENSLLEGLYNSMSDMAFVIAEAFGLTEATKAAKLYAQGKLSAKAARKAGVMAANVRGGERAVAQKYKESGIDPEDAEKFAKNRAEASRRARKPGMSPTSQASALDLAKGMVRGGTNWLKTQRKPGVGGKAAAAHEVRRYRAGKLAGKESPKKPNMIKTNPK